MSLVAQRIIGEADELPPQPPEEQAHMSQAMKNLALKVVRKLAGKGCVRKYQVVDHGIENTQYFQGCSSHNYDTVYTGIGGSAHEAMEDALDQAAMAGWEVTGIPNRFDPDSPDTVEASVRQLRDYEPEDEVDWEGGEGEDMYYHVSLRLAGDPP